MSIGKYPGQCGHNSWTWESVGAHRAWRARCDDELASDWQILQGGAHLFWGDDVDVLRTREWEHDLVFPGIVDPNKLINRHLVLVRKKSNFTLYLDGELVESCNKFLPEFPFYLGGIDLPAVELNPSKDISPKISLGGDITFTHTDAIFSTSSEASPGCAPGNEDNVLGYYNQKLVGEFKFTFTVDTVDCRQQGLVFGLLETNSPATSFHPKDPENHVAGKRWAISTKCFDKHGKACSLPMPDCSFSGYAFATDVATEPGTEANTAPEYYIAGVI